MWCLLRALSELDDVVTSTGDYARMEASPTNPAIVVVHQDDNSNSQPWTCAAFTRTTDTDSVDGSTVS